LGGQRWFTGQEYGIADIALFAYTAVAGDGGFDLSGYPALLDWLQRVRATPGFVQMPPASGQLRDWIGLAMQVGAPGHEEGRGRLGPCRPPGAAGLAAARAGPPRLRRDAAGIRAGTRVDRAVDAARPARPRR